MHPQHRTGNMLVLLVNPGTILHKEQHLADSVNWVMEQGKPEKKQIQNNQPPSPQITHTEAQNTDNFGCKAYLTNSPLKASICSQL